MWGPVSCVAVTLKARTLAQELEPLALDSSCPGEYNATVYLGGRAMA